MKTIKKTIAELDDVFACTVDLPPLISAGDEYEAEFLHSELKRNWDGSAVHKVFLRFRIVAPADAAGRELYMACNGPRGKKWPASSKYTRAWIVAAGRKPERADRLTTKVFEGKRFRVRVRVVEHDRHRHPLSPEQRYSVIDDVLERLSPGDD
jgi:hypothetical protein